MVPPDGDAPAAADILPTVVQALTKLVDGNEKRKGHLQSELKDPAQAEDLTTRGNALNAMPRSKWRKGMTTVEAPDWSQFDDQGNPRMLTFELDPNKDFQDNAKLMFKQAKKIRRGRVKIMELTEQLDEVISRWRPHLAEAEAWQEELAAGSLSPESEAAVLRVHGTLLQEGAVKPPKKKEPRDEEAEKKAAFRRKYGKDIDCFRSPGGHEVVAGRSSKMNEHVSLRLANGEMPWFHTANGIPGSHVCIRAQWDDVAEEDFLFAAKIAAFHSKGKNDLHVPVMYCRGRQVKKIKKTRMGSVHVSGDAYELVVTPGLPEE